MLQQIARSINASLPRVVNANRLVWLGFGLVIIVGLSVYYPNLGALGLQADDWRELAENHFDGSTHYRGDRPLQALLVTVLLAVTRMNVNYAHVLMLILDIASAVVLFLVMNDLLGGVSVISVMTSILFLVYPSNYTHAWVEMQFLPIVLILIFVSFLLYRNALQSTRWEWAWIVSMLLLVVALLIYELPVGIVLLFPILSVSVWWPDRRGLLQLLRAAFPLMICLMFVLWRLVEFNGSADPVYTTRVNWHEFLSDMPTQLIFAYKTMFIYSWSEPTRLLLGTPAPRWQILAILCTPIPLIIVWYLIRTTLLRARKMDNPITLGKPRSIGRRFLVLSLGTSLACVGLGVLPALPVANPWIAGLGSRLTAVASIGAAAGLSILAYSASILLVKDTRRAGEFTILALMPFVIIAGASQWAAQRAMASVWTDQRRMWSEMLRIAPSLVPSTCVYIVNVPDAVSIWDFPVLHLPGEVAGAVRLLYDDPSLCGGLISVNEEVQMGDQGTKLYVDGLKPRFATDLVSYDRIVMFGYQDNGCLHLLETVPVSLKLPREREIPLAVARILPTSSSRPFNYLVEPAIYCSEPN